jgi:hypothetical protein
LHCQSQIRQPSVFSVACAFTGFFCIDIGIQEQICRFRNGRRQILSSATEKDTRTSTLAFSLRPGFEDIG